ncbi:MAG: ATP-binding protein [Acutalibacteraceae bacterium]
MSFLDEFFINKHGIEECEGDYRDENDILICGKCGTPKECIKVYKGKKGSFPCRCKCDDIAEAEYQQRKAKEKFDDRVKRLRAKGITSKRYREYTFANDNGSKPEITKQVKRYVERWDEIKANNIGVLFYGDVGTGKSFYAACIANALIDKGVPVHIATLSDLVRLRTANYGKDDINLDEFDLLIVDDLGVENASPTAYSIIDERYLSNKPLIITTNLTPAQLKNPKAIEQKRIYDRVLEMCGGEPIRIDGGSKRGEVAKQKREIAKNIFNS